MVPYILRYFLQLVGYTLGAIVMCGLAVWVCQTLFIRLLGGQGSRIVIATAIIGTPVHELGHALMCILFGHRITAIRLWQPSSPDGTLGYVSHTYNPSNVFQQLGNIFIACGPIFSGLIVLGLCLHYAFPAALAAYTGTVTSMLDTSTTALELLAAGVQIVPDMAEEFLSDSFPVWARVILVIVMLSVSLHINLSPADMRNALRGVPMYLGVALLIAVITSYASMPLTHSIIWYLKMLNAYMMAMFTIILVFALLQVLIALVIWLIKRIGR